MNTKTERFLGIIDQHKGIIYKIASSYCKSTEDQKDLTQEIIIQLWQSFANYDDKFKPSTWIYRISLNTAISHYRKGRTRKRASVEITPIIETTMVAEDPYTEDSNLSILQEFIQELKELDRAIILLYLDGLSQKEIARIIGLTPTNIGTKLSRIKKVLQKKFNLKKQEL